VQLLSLMSYNS